MCYSRDYKFEDQGKKADTELRRAESGVLDKMRNNANKEAEKAKETPTKEVAPAK